MVANAQKKWTVEEYLAFERKSEERHEYIDGVVFPVGHPPQPSTYGVGRRHSLILVNIISSLGHQLVNVDSEIYAVDMRVKADPTTFIYPDVSVVSTEPQFMDDIFDTLVNPTTIIEVLSPYTEAYDRGTKFKHYAGINSLQEYVLIAQDEAHVEHYLRTSDTWQFSEAKTLEKVIELPSIGCTLHLADIYRKITFPTDDQPQNT